MKLENCGEAQVGIIQISKETLTRRQIRDICDSLQKQTLTVLALRECTIRDGDYKKLLKFVSVCESLVQLNFNVNVVNSDERVTLLAKCLKKNKSLKSLYLHGSDLSGEKLWILTSSLCRHPGLISLDLGDCTLTDAKMEDIIPLLSPRNRFKGLVELGLSGNTLVTSAGWCRLFQALAVCHRTCRLTSLYLDYCHLGNKAVTCLATALAALATIQTVDLENTNISDTGGQFILYLAEAQRTNRLATVNLHGNDLDPELVDAIQSRLQSSPTPSSESESDSESEYGESRSMMVTDPAKLEALETLTRALNAYTRTYADDNDRLEERVVEREADVGVEATPSGENRHRVTADETTNGAIDPDVASIASDDSAKTMFSLSSLSEPPDVDDVIDDDVTRMEDAELSLAEPEDQGDFLREIPIAPSYTVIQPVTLLSRASAGYLF